MSIAEPEGAVGIVATLDTKSAEASFVAEIVKDEARRVVLFDTGTRGARSSDPAELLRRNAEEVKRQVEEQCASGAVTAILGIAGGKGSGAFGHIVSDLPYGFPKLLVSSARPALLAELAGRSDILLYPTLVDLFGINAFTRRVLTNAGRAVAAMHASADETSEGRKIVAITAFGVTTPAVESCVELLRQAGVDAVAFPANGAGGRRMEALLDAGEFHAVLDLTTTELADEIVGGTASAGSGRLTAAGRRGLPQLVAPGAVDMVNFGSRGTVPEAFRNRTLYSHTPFTTLMRTTAEENEWIGRLAAGRLADAKGPVAVLWPARGVSDYDREGGVFFDLQADRAWLAGMRGGLPAHVQCSEIDSHINDPAFAKAAVDWIVKQLGEERRP